MLSFIARGLHLLRCGGRGGRQEVPIRLIHQSGITPDDREEGERRTLREQVIRQRDVENMTGVQITRKQHRAEYQHQPYGKENGRQPQVVPPMAAQGGRFVARKHEAALVYTGELNKAKSMINENTPAAWAG